MTLSVFKNGTSEPCPGTFNFARYVLAAADTTPDKTALEVLDRPDRVTVSLNFAQLRARVLATARAFADAGIRPKHLVVLRLGNDPVFPIAYLAAAAMGALPVPTSASLTAREFSDIVEQLDPIGAIVSDDPALNRPDVLHRDAVWNMGLGPEAEFAPTLADDPAYIVFTSGSSGRPKGVVHAHRAVWARRMMWRDWYDLRASDRMLHAGALNWTYTLGTGLMDPWAIGATALVYTGPPDRHVWPSILQRHTPTLFAAAPGVLRQIAEADQGGLKPACRTLRHVLSAGEALNPAVRDTFERASGRKIHTALGMSEVSTYVSTSPQTGVVPDGAGLPQRGRHVAVLGDDDAPVTLGKTGDLVVHRDDPGLMLGYYRKGQPPDLPLTGDWFVTGDRAKMLAGGAILHQGRRDELLTAGGYRVAPQEVEACLANFPGIAEVAVTSAELRDGVTVIAAFYTGSRVDEAALKAFASAGLARYKTPRLFVHMDALPRRANGKLARKELTTRWQNR